MRLTLAGIFGGWLVMLVCVFLFCGVLGMFLWPYIINTWAEYANLDEREEWNPVGKLGGFGLGVCPVVGQIMIPVAIITGVCDMIFIPD